jgi:hypothetical protein
MTEDSEQCKFRYSRILECSFDNLLLFLIT